MKTETIDMGYKDFKIRQKYRDELRAILIKELEKKYQDLDATRAHDEYSFCHVEGYSLCLKDIINLIKEKE